MATVLATREQNLIDDTKTALDAAWSSDKVAKELRKATVSTFTGTFAECQEFLNSFDYLPFGVTVTVAEPVTTDPTVSVPGLTITRKSGSELTIVLQSGTVWTGIVELVRFQNCTNFNIIRGVWSVGTRVRRLEVANSQVWSESITSDVVSVTQQSFLLWSYCFAQNLSVQEGSICEQNDRSGAASYSGRGKIQCRAANSNLLYSGTFASFQGWVEDQTTAPKRNTFLRGVRHNPTPVMLWRAPSTPVVSIKTTDCLTFVGDTSVVPTTTGMTQYSNNAGMFVQINTTPGNLWITDQNKRTDFCINGVWQATLSHKVFMNVNSLSTLSTDGTPDPLLWQIRTGWDWSGVPVQTAADPLTAPASDGKTYVMKDGAWVEDVGGLVNVFTAQNPKRSDYTTVIELVQDNLEGNWGADSSWSPNLTDRPDGTTQPYRITFWCERLVGGSHAVIVTCTVQAATDYSRWQATININSGTYTEPWKKLTTSKELTTDWKVISSTTDTTLADIILHNPASPYISIAPAVGTTLTDLPVELVPTSQDYIIVHAFGTYNNSSVRVTAYKGNIIYTGVLLSTGWSTINPLVKVVTANSSTTGTVIGPPDYANVLPTVITNSYTCPNNGWIYATPQGAVATFYPLVDGHGVARTDGAVGSWWGYMQKGQVLTNISGSPMQVINYPELPAVLDVPTVNPLLNVGQPDFTQVQIKATGVGSGAASLTWTVDRDGYVWCDGGAVGTTGTMQMSINGRSFVLGTSIGADWINSTAVPMYLKAGTVYSVGVTAQMRWQAAGVPHIYWCPAELTPPVYLESAPVLDYSMAEQDTGRKWIDGKTIYQKTVTWTGAWTAASNNNIGSPTTLIPGATQIIDNLIIASVQGAKRMGRASLAEITATSVLLMPALSWGDATTINNITLWYTK